MAFLMIIRENQVEKPVKKKEVSKVLLKIRM